MYIYIVSYKKEHTENKVLYYFMEYCVIYKPELKEISDFMYFTDQIFFFNSSYFYFYFFYSYPLYLMQTFISGRRRNYFAIYCIYIYNI